MFTRSQICLIISFAIVLGGCAGSKLPNYEYQKVTEVDASADEIYTKTEIWMAERFVSSEDAIQIRDEENHRIVANARKKMPVGTGGVRLPVEFDLTVESKDGRFRMTGRNFIIHTDAGTQEYETPIMEKQTDDVQKEMDQLRSDLKSHIQSRRDDDW